MRAITSSIALALLASSAGCLRSTEFKCATDADCSTSGAVCEGTGYCSFPDDACAMGRRYGDYAGPYSKTCVGDVVITDGGMGDGATDTPPAGCPTTYMTLPNAGAHVYKLTANAQVWATQRDRCAAEGAYLAVPDTLAELQAIATAGAAARTWVGLTDSATEGTFLTVTGMTPALSPLPWGAAEPDDAMGGQDCVSALMASPTIQTDKCGDTLPAVCECEP
jgi:hypothetical protein